jgi:hypothetical protein
MHAKALLLAVLLAAPLAAGAQNLPAGAQPSAVIPTPLQDLASDDGVMARAERLWGGVADAFGFGFGTGSLTRGHVALQQRQRARDDFAWLMDIAGYKLKEIESSVSLLPSLSLTFGQARELTEADREYVERMLERHALRNPGPLAAMQRTIVRGVMDAGELGHFSVDKVEVDLFPLPRVKFQLTPTDAPLGIEASRILRAIDRLNQRVTVMAQRQAGTGNGRQLLELPAPGQAPLVPATIGH